MPKTRDAFALEGFDDKRILARIFNGYGEKTDSAIIDSHSKNFALENAIKLHANCIFAMNQYQTRLTRHSDKLMKYSVHLIRNFPLDDKIQAKIRRAQNLADRYADACRAVQNLQRALFNAIATIEDGNADSVRRRFAERLRQARKKKNMTQQDVANLIHMSAGGYTQYELARRDPSIPTLIKLARILDCSADWLLGLTA